MEERQQRGLLCRVFRQQRVAQHAAAQAGKQRQMAVEQQLKGLPVALPRPFHQHVVAVLVHAALHAVKSRLGQPIDIIPMDVYFDHPAL